MQTHPQCGFRGAVPPTWQWDEWDQPLLCVSVENPAVQGLFPLAGAAGGSRGLCAPDFSPVGKNRLSANPPVPIPFGADPLSGDLQLQEADVASVKGFSLPPG